MKFDPLHETVDSHPFRKERADGAPSRRIRAARESIGEGALPVRDGAFSRNPSPVTIEGALAIPTGRRNPHNGKRFTVADTKKIADKAERKKLKRASRKKAAPKAKRTTPRGSQKKKVKKMARGQSKR